MDVEVGEGGGETDAGVDGGGGVSDDTARGGKGDTSGADGDSDAEFSASGALTGVGARAKTWPLAREVVATSSDRWRRAGLAWPR